MTEPAGVVSRAGHANDGRFREVLSTSPAAIRQLADAVRDLVFDVFPPTVEVVWPKQRAIGWGTGPKKFTEQFAYLMAVQAPRHARLLPRR